MKQDNALQVYYDEKLVGTLAMTANRKAAFQYTDEWLEHGFSISPFSLPLKKQVFVPTKDYFGGLYGVFADSLPDNWGRLLLNRLLREHKQNPDKLTVLDRLAIVGKSGMGALTYYPERKFPEQRDNPDLDELARECQKILNTEYTDKLDRRFDRVPDQNGIKRVHMLTAAALLELDFEQPSLDYHSLMKLTKILTKDHYADVESMFRRMCFNVFAHNRDDHSKNFTYLYDEEKDQWRLSPAYDLTYSNTYYGEHTTTVDGNGKDPGRKELLAVGITAGMKKNRCMEIIDEIERCVGEMLGDYL